LFLGITLKKILMGSVVMNLADRDDSIYNTNGKFEVGKEYAVDDYKETVEKIEITECEAK